MNFTKLALAAILALSTTAATKALACDPNPGYESMQDVKALMEKTMENNAHFVVGFKSISDRGVADETQDSIWDVQYYTPSEKNQDDGAVCRTATFSLSSRYEYGKDDDGASCGERIVEIEPISDIEGCAK